jgi:cytochrome P450
MHVLQNDLIAFILAGHDTTANALSSAFYYLAKDKVLIVNTLSSVLA